MMNRIVSQIAEFLRRLPDEPEVIRRRWAKAFFWGSMPIVVFLWWLSINIPVVERTAFDAARSAAASGKVAAANVAQGVANLKTAFGILKSALENELQSDDAPARAPAPERFTLPIAK